MNDLELATKLLAEKNAAIIIVKDGKLVYEGYEKGIKPLYLAYRSDIDFEGASMADRVIGKAAALILSELKISRLHSKVISEGAVKILKVNSVEFFYESKVPFIKNMRKNDLCPVEKLSQATDDFDELIIKIESFLKNIQGGVKTN